MLLQEDCPKGARAGDIIHVVLDRGEQACKDVVQMVQGMGTITGEESLADDRDRVEERAVE
jgi:hypothetical protein